MDQDLEKAEQGLATEFNEKLDVTETPVTPASDTETFVPETTPEVSPEAPTDVPATESTNS